MHETCDAESSGVERAVNIATRGSAVLALCQHHTKKLGANLTADGWAITTITAYHDQLLATARQPASNPAPESVWIRSAPSTIFQPPAL